MGRRITFALILLSLTLVPSQAIFFKAFQYLSGDAHKGRQLRRLGANEEWHLTDGNSYTGSTEIHENSFGFESRQQDNIRSGGINTQYFESGPSSIKWLEGDASQYYGSATLDLNTVDANLGYFGLFSDATKADYMSITCKHDGSTNGVVKDSNGNVVPGVTAYCDNFADATIRTRMDIVSGNYAQSDVSGSIVPSFLCTSSSTSSDAGSLPQDRWDTATGHYTGGHASVLNLCKNAEFSTDDGVKTSSSGDTSFAVTDFHTNGVESLDKQCYTDRDADRYEFDSIQCDDADHPEEHDGTQNGNVGLSIAALLNGGTSMDDITTADTTCSNNTDCGYQDIASRYPKQEYCLAAKDRTIFKELFGCADDQRVTCGTTTQSADGACAGGIDAANIDSHVDFLPSTWYDADGVTADLLAKGYGNQANDGNHVCSEAEISVANELSAYLDKVDQDITKACYNAMETFETASAAYVSFVTPGSDFYEVLKAAWQHAEFTVRSMKIQEQVRDRMLKYRDWTLFRFSLLEQTPTGGGDANSAATRDHADTVAAQIQRPSAKSGTETDQDASEAYKAYLTVWDDHIKAYETLSLNEFNALMADMLELKTQVDAAKAHAQILAHTQTTASAAVATVSTHFRKKMKLWVNIEHLLENAMHKALSDADALHGEANREMMYANYGRTDSQTQPTHSFTADTTAPSYSDGTGYKYHESNSSYTRNSEASDTTSFTASADENYIAEFKTSNAEIITDYACSASGDCPASLAQANYPAHDRAAECRDSKCVLKASTLGGETHVETHTVNHDKSATERGNPSFVDVTAPETEAPGTGGCAAVSGTSTGNPQHILTSDIVNVNGVSDAQGCLSVTCAQVSCTGGSTSSDDLWYKKEVAQYAALSGHFTVEYLQGTLQCKVNIFSADDGATWTPN